METTKAISLTKWYQIRESRKLTQEEKDLIRRMEDTEKEVNDERLYQKYFKPNCVSCGAVLILGNSSQWEYYQQYGNYCNRCSFISGEVASGSMLRHDCMKCQMRLYIRLPDHEERKDMRSRKKAIGRIMARVNGAGKKDLEDYLDRVTKFKDIHTFCPRCFKVYIHRFELSNKKHKSTVSQEFGLKD